MRTFHTLALAAFLAFALASPASATAYVASATAYVVDAGSCTFCSSEVKAISVQPTTQPSALTCTVNAALPLASSAATFATATIQNAGEEITASTPLVGEDTDGLDDPIIIPIECDVFLVCFPGEPCFIIIVC